MRGGGTQGKFHENVLTFDKKSTYFSDVHGIVRKINAKAAHLLKIWRELFGFYIRHKHFGEIMSIKGIFRSTFLEIAHNFGLNDACCSNIIACFR